MTNLATQATRTGRVVLRAENVWKSFDDGAIAVLRGVDLEAEQGETVKNPRFPVLLPEPCHIKRIHQQGQQSE